MKYCKKCKKTKYKSEFYKDKQKKDGLRFWCKDCILEYVYKYNKIDPERKKKMRKNSYLKRNYGITIDDYDRMYEEQGGKCFICPNKLSILNIDHSHKTGKVRKLLCNRCNRVLGILEESEELIMSILNYIRAYSDNG